MLTQHLVVIPFNFLGIIDLLSLTKWIFIQNYVIHDNISSQVADKRGWGFGQWMNSSTIHDSICSLIQKCHPKRYQGHIKYHTTLYISYNSVVGTCEFNPIIFSLHLGWFVLIHTRKWWASNQHENSPVHCYYEWSKWCYFIHISNIRTQSTSSV